MLDPKLVEQVRSTVATARRIVIIQADNPDADSLGSALALEHILGDLDKEVFLYSSVDMPGYLKYLSGWDRVNKYLPGSFDAAILVDASVTSLLANLSDLHFKGALASKPFVILDHHQTVTDTIAFASTAINTPELSSTGELIYELSEASGWPVSSSAGTMIMAAILGDTQGLSNELTRPTTYRTMAELIETGVNRPALEEARREFSKMPEPIFRYKGELIGRTELYNDDTVAVLSIPQAEINTYSPLYNPSALIQVDTLQTIGVKISVVFKLYDSGRITAAIRANAGSPIAGQLAESFGGGGHNYASGFKLEDGRPFNEIKSECIRKATDLLQQNN